MSGDPRMRQVAAVWNWLPAFRAVAETEHLPTAARQLGTSAPALSRTVRLLEDALGEPLFDRVGGRLSLNDAGRALLTGVRDAMRGVHDALTDATLQAFRGQLLVATAGLATHAFVLPALAELQTLHPALVCKVRPRPADLARALLQGQLDVVIHSTPFHHPELVSEDLGTQPSAVYCGPGHPLYEKKAPTREQILEHAFAAPPAGPHGWTSEGWPPRVSRKIGMELGGMQQGVTVCRSGALLAVLPVVVARAWPELRALPLDGIADSPVIAVRRPTLGRPGAAELLVDLVRSHIG